MSAGSRHMTGVPAGIGFFAFFDFFWTAKAVVENPNAMMTKAIISALSLVCRNML
jgi:hypothetical protein